MAHLFDDDAERGVIGRWSRDVQQEVDAELESAARNPTATPVIMIGDVFGSKSGVDRAKPTPQLQEGKRVRSEFGCVGIRRWGWLRERRRLNWRGRHDWN